MNKPWHRDMAWLMLKTPSSVNYYKEVLYYNSG